MENNLLLLEIQNDIGILKLNHGITNAINLDLVSELADAIQKAKSEFRVRGLVLSSTNDKFFSIGFNIPELIELPEEDLGRFYKAFNQMCLDLFTLPKPTVAAISGHAIAGGCILALCCDYRFVAQGRKWMGLNEIKLGLPVPYVADCILRELVGFRNARDVMDSGDFYPPETSLQMGLVDGVLPLDEVLSQALEKAGRVGDYPESAFAAIKRNRTEEIKNQIQSKLDEREKIFIESWLSTAAQGLLREAIANF